jgi:hypothetical protein
MATAVKVTFHEVFYSLRRIDSEAALQVIEKISRKCGLVENGSR